MKLRELQQHLHVHGCELLREGGRHSWWHNPQLGRRSAVPRHSEINNHLVRKICLDLSIPSPATGK